MSQPIAIPSSDFSYPLSHSSSFPSTASVDGSSAASRGILRVSSDVLLTSASSSSSVSGAEFSDSSDQSDAGDADDHLPASQPSTSPLTEASTLEAKLGIAMVNRPEAVSVSLDQSSAASSAVTSTPASPHHSCPASAALERRVDSLSRELAAVRSAHESDLARLNERFNNELNLMERRLQSHFERQLGLFMRQFQRKIISLADGDEVQSTGSDTPKLAAPGSSASCPNLAQLDANAATAAASHRPQMLSFSAAEIEQAQAHAAAASGSAADEDWTIHNSQPSASHSPINLHIPHKSRDPHYSISKPLSASKHSHHYSFEPASNSFPSESAFSSSVSSGSGSISEEQLIALACRILSEHGSVPVGKMGSLLHKAANDHTLPALLKERYGGLKKFLQSQPRYFELGSEHLYNPSVTLRRPLMAGSLGLGNSGFRLDTSMTPPVGSSKGAPADPPHFSMAGSGSRPHFDSHPYSMPANLNLREFHSPSHAHSSGSSSTNSGAVSSHPHSHSHSSLPARNSSTSASSTNLAGQIQPDFPSQSRSKFPFTSSSVPFRSNSNTNLQSLASMGGGNPLSTISSIQSIPSIQSISSIQPISSSNGGANHTHANAHSHSHARRGVFESAGEIPKFPSFKPESPLTDVLALDCEMVGGGSDGSKSILARCSLVNSFGAIVYNRFVQPTEPVTDYRTHVSGIRPGDLEPPTAIPFQQCQAEVAQLIQGRILVAHSIAADLQALSLSHPVHLIRDTAFCEIFCPGRPRSLKTLVQERLGWIGFQTRHHDSIEDARAVLTLYQSVESEWEEQTKIQIANGTLVNPLSALPAINAISSQLNNQHSHHNHSHAAHNNHSHSHNHNLNSNLNSLSNSLSATSSATSTPVPNRVPGVSALNSSSSPFPSQFFQSPGSNNANAIRSPNAFK